MMRLPELAAHLVGEVLAWLRGHREPDGSPFGPPSLRSRTRCLPPGCVVVDRDRDATDAGRQHHAPAEIAARDPGPGGQAEAEAGGGGRLEALGDEQLRAGPVAPGLHAAEAALGSP